MPSPWWNRAAYASDEDDRTKRQGRRGFRFGATSGNPSSKRAFEGRWCLHKLHSSESRMAYRRSVYQKFIRIELS
jgi:hypothetical protein